MHNFYTFIAPVITLFVSAAVSAYPTADGELGEKLYPAEAYYADKIERTVAQTLSPDHALRDAHPKAHGCVGAKFNVLDDLPQDLVHGVFEPGSTYDAWVRFSNGSNDPLQDDGEGDTRGMAIKLLGVAGDKLLPEPSEAASQDFIMISTPRFFVNEPSDYAGFFQALEGEWWEMIKIPYFLGWQGSISAWEMLRTTIANPLDTRYWSVVPYQLGEGQARQAVKYSVRPCEPLHAVIPENAGPNYLREAMSETLRENAACMEFMVQRKTPAMSLEDVVTEWEEEAAPFHPVARLHIPAQQFNSPAQRQLCDSLSFNPWHALSAHKPLGAIGRIRLQVYQGISAQRLSLGGEVRRPPPVPDALRD
jgi:hypothetical protein